MKRLLLVVGIVGVLGGLSASAYAVDNNPHDSKGAGCGIARFVLNNPDMFTPQMVSQTFDYWREYCVTPGNGL